MKKIVVILIFLIYSFNTTLALGLSLDKQNNYKVKIDTLYNNYFLTFNNLSLDEKNKVVQSLDLKISKLISTGNLSEKNLFILNYIHEKNLLLINDYNKTKETNLVETGTTLEKSNNSICNNELILINNECVKISDNQIYKNLLSLLSELLILEKDISNIKLDFENNNTKLISEIGILKNKYNIELNELVKKNNNIITDLKEQLNNINQDSINSYSNLGVVYTPSTNSESQIALLEAQAKYNEAIIKQKYDKIIIEYNNIISDNNSKITEIDIRLKMISSKIQSIQEIKKYFESSGDEKGTITLLTGIFYYNDLIWIDTYVKNNGIIVKGYYRTLPNYTKKDNLSCILKGGNYCN